MDVCHLRVLAKLGGEDTTQSTAADKVGVQFDPRSLLLKRLNGLYLVHMGMVLPRFIAVMLVRTSWSNAISCASVLSCLKRTSFPTAIPSIKLAGYLFSMLYISASCRARVVALVSTQTPMNTVILTLRS